MTIEAGDKMFQRMAVRPDHPKRGKLYTPWQIVEFTQSEDSHQTALFMWADKAAKYGLRAANDPEVYTSPNGRHKWAPDSVPELDSLFAIPNGGLRNPVTALRLRATGVKSGVPDLFLPCVRGGYSGLFIELKRPDGETVRRGTLSSDQVGWAHKLRKSGYCVATCYGWRNAVDALTEYLAMRKDVEA